MIQKLTVMIRNKNYNRVVCAVLLLLSSAVLVTKLPFTENVARAAAQFLSSVTHDATLTGDGTSSVPLGIATNGVGTSQLASSAVTAPKIASGQVVKSINGLNDGVTLAAGSNVSLALTGQTLTISSLLGLTSVNHDATLSGDGTSLSALGISDASITNEHIRSGEVVRELNNLRDSVTLVGGSNVTITPTGNNTLTIAANIPPQPSTPQPYINPRRVAALQWYEAIQTGLQYPAPPGTNQIAFDGDNLWVSRSLFGSVSKIRVNDGAVLGTFSVTGGEALGMAFDGANIWVACGDFSRSVVKLRASDGQNLGGFTLPVDPFGLAFDGSHIWATLGANGTVAKIRTVDGAIVGIFNAGPSPLKIAFDGANVWVTNQTASSVTKIRASDGSLLATYNVAPSPNSIAFDGANMWITHPGSNLVTKLRASDGMVLGTFSVGPSPVGVVFDGANIWVGNRSSNTVSKLRASDGILLGAFTAGSGPGNLAFDGANVWAINHDSGTLSKL